MLNKNHYLISDVSIYVLLQKNYRKEETVLLNNDILFSQDTNNNAICTVTIGEDSFIAPLTVLFNPQDPKSLYGDLYSYQVRKVRGCLVSGADYPYKYIIVFRYKLPGTKKTFTYYNSTIHPYQTLSYDLELEILTAYYNHQKISVISSLTGVSQPTIRKKIKLFEESFSSGIYSQVISSDFKSPVDWKLVVQSFTKKSFQKISAIYLNILLNLNSEKPNVSPDKELPEKVQANDLTKSERESKLLIVFSILLMESFLNKLFLEERRFFLYTPKIKNSS
jgi:hypothetical protein